MAACAVLALLTDALIAVGSGAWAHAAASAAGIAAAAATFTVLERHSAHPVLNRALLRSSGVRAGLVAGAAVNFALNGNLFVLPLLFQHNRHLSAIATGLAFLPLTLPFALNPLVTGRLAARFGPRPPILAGMALLAAGGAGLGCAARAGAGTAGSPSGCLFGTRCGHWPHSTAWRRPGKRASMSSRRTVTIRLRPSATLLISPASRSTR